MAGQAKENLPGGGLEYLFAYLKVRIFKCSYRSFKPFYRNWWGVAFIYIYIYLYIYLRIYIYMQLAVYVYIYLYMHLF